MLTLERLETMASYQVVFVRSMWCEIRSVRGKGVLDIVY